MICTIIIDEFAFPVESGNIRPNLTKETEMPSLKERREKILSEQEQIKSNRELELQRLDKLRNERLSKVKEFKVELAKIVQADPRYGQVIASTRSTEIHEAFQEIWALWNPQVVKSRTVKRPKTIRVPGPFMGVREKKITVEEQEEYLSPDSFKPVTIISSFERTIDSVVDSRHLENYEQISSEIKEEITSTIIKQLFGSQTGYDWTKEESYIIGNTSMHTPSRQYWRGAAPILALELKTTEPPKGSKLLSQYFGFTISFYFDASIDSTAMVIAYLTTEESRKSYIFYSISKLLDYLALNYQEYVESYVYTPRTDFW